MRRCERPDLPRNGVYFSYGPLLSSFLGATTLFLPLRSLPSHPGVLNSAFCRDTRRIPPRIFIAALRLDLSTIVIGDVARQSSRRKIEQTIQERRSLSLLRAAGAYVSRRVRVARGIERINKNDAGSAGDTVTHRFARSLARSLASLPARSRDLRPSLPVLPLYPTLSLVS